MAIRSGFPCLIQTPWANWSDLEARLPASFFNPSVSADQSIGHYTTLMSNLQKKAYLPKGGRLSVQAAQFFLLGLGQVLRDAYCISQCEPDDEVFKQNPEFANVDFNIPQFVDLEHAIITVLPMLKGMQGAIQMWYH